MFIVADLVSLSCNNFEKNTSLENARNDPDQLIGRWPDVVNLPKRGFCRQYIFLKLCDLPGLCNVLVLLQWQRYPVTACYIHVCYHSKR